MAIAFFFPDDTHSDGDEEGDEEEMEMEAVMPTGVYVHGRNKRNSCLFCTRKVRLLWRHMKTCHLDESDVQQIMECGDVEKGKKITLLRFKGNFEHNKRIKAKGKGELIVGRRAAGDYKASDFLPCPHCLQYILRSDLKKHRQKSCLVEREQGRASEAGTKAIVFESLLLMNEVGESEFSSFEAEILSRMSDGPVKERIYKDPLIMKFGAILFEKLGLRGFANISQRLRAIASFLMVSNVSTMTDFLVPENIDEAVSCAKVVGA